MIAIAAIAKRELRAVKRNLFMEGRINFLGILFASTSIVAPKAR